MVASKTVAYVTRDGQELLADVFVPDGPGPFPGMVLLHGGAFTKGSRSSCRPWGRYLAERGLVALAADYRLAAPGRPTFPAAVLDAKAAVRYLRASAADLHVDVDRVAILGSSAGAYLAAMVALTGEEPSLVDMSTEPSDVSAKVDAAILLAGTYDLLARWEHDRSHRAPDDQPAEVFLGGTPMSARRRYYEASPVFYASERAARPVKWLIGWGTDDENTPPAEHSERFAHLLTLAGALVRIVPISGAPHYWYMDADVQDRDSFSGQMAQRLQDFLATWCGWR